MHQHIKQSHNNIYIQSHKLGKIAIIANNLHLHTSFLERKNIFLGRNFLEYEEYNT